MGYCFALVRGNSRSTVHNFSSLDSERYISFNHSWYFNRVMGAHGIQSIYGMKAKDAAPLLKNAIDALNPIIERERRTRRVASRTWSKGHRYNEEKANADKVWYTCALNAQRALQELLRLCEAAPFFTWSAYPSD